MSEAQRPIKAGYHAYPEAKEGPETTYLNPPASNPVLRGLPLSIAGSACVLYRFSCFCSDKSIALQILDSSPAFYGAMQASARYES